MPIMPTPAQSLGSRHPHSPTPTSAGSGCLDPAQVHRVGTCPGHCSRKALQGISPFSAHRGMCCICTESVVCATENLRAKPEVLPPLRSAFSGKPRGLNRDIERVNNLHLKTVFCKGNGTEVWGRAIDPLQRDQRSRARLYGIHGTAATHGSGIAACAVPCQRKGKKLEPRCPSQVPTEAEGSRERCRGALLPRAVGAGKRLHPCGTRDEPPCSGKT